MSQERFALRGVDVTNEALAAFYWRSLITRGYAPTYREVAAYAGIGLGSVSDRLELLVRAGLIPGFKHQGVRS